MPDVGPVDAYLGRLAGSSARVQRAALDTAARILTGDSRDDCRTVAWETLRHGDLIRLRDSLASTHEPATVNRILAAVRGVLRAAFRKGMLDGDTVARVGDVPGVPVAGLPTGRALGANELEALVLAAASHRRPEVSLRDAALVSLLAGTGLRIAELAALDVGDLVGDIVTVRRGKGGKGREVPLPPKAAVRVADWLTARGMLSIGPAVGFVVGPLFVIVAENEPASVGRPLGVQSCRQRVERAARAAGLDGVTPHDLRRTYVTRLLDAGADPLLVGALVGHANPRTTARYDRRALTRARPFLNAVDV